MKNSNRSLLFVLICLLLCTCFALSVSASGSTVNDAISDAVNDAVNGSVAEAGDGGNILENLEGVAEDLENDLPGALGDLIGFDELGEIVGVEVILAVVAILGVILCFFGYRLLKLCLMLLGFAGGWTLGSLGYEFVVKNLIEDASSLPEFVPILVNFVFGAILAFLAPKLLALAIFISTAVWSYIFLSGVDFIKDIVDGIVEESGETKYIIARLIAAIVLGLLAVLLHKLAVILSTSATGGFVAGFSAMELFGLSESVSIPMLVSVILVLLGVIVQFRADRKKKQRSGNN